MSLLPATVPAVDVRTLDGFPTGGIGCSPPGLQPGATSSATATAYPHATHCHRPDTRTAVSVSLRVGPRPHDCDVQREIDGERPEEQPAGVVGSTADLLGHLARQVLGRVDHDLVVQEEDQVG